jgi:hypothetical protein
MVRTESGRVFSWGYNEFGQLGLNNNNKDVDKPSIVSLSNEISIKKISCGLNHSLLLSQNGDIYWFEDNGCEEQIIPKKLKNNKMKFIDIASHYYYEICVAISEQSVYFWGLLEEEKEVKDEISSENLKRTQFQTIEEFFNKYFEINYKPIEKLIDFKSKITENGKYITI